MRIILQTTLLLVFINAQAQLPNQLIKSVSKTTMFEGYAGSVYVDNQYKDASIIDEKSGTYNAKLRYNMHTDALEYSKGDNLYEIAKSTTTHIRIGGKYYYFCKFKNQRGFNKHGYYILLELNDQYRIYKKNELRVTQPQERDVVTGSSTIGKLRNIEKYYLEIDGIVTELPTGKRDILTLFSDYQEPLKKYLKKEKIRLKNPEDLIRFVAKYNALKNSNISPSRSLLSNTVQNN